MLLVRLRRLLGLKAVVQISFAEYHSKRNPVERVHAVHTKELEKHGPFNVPILKVTTLEHETKIEEMRDCLGCAERGKVCWEVHDSYEGSWL